MIVTMYIRKTTKKVKDRIYENYLLVESVMTPKGLVPEEEYTIPLDKAKLRKKVRM